ncbi:MAG: hypothetical protein ACT4PW_09185 [Acidimicrobiia bacterium]
MLVVLLVAAVLPLLVLVAEPAVAAYPVPARGFQTVAGSGSQ